jgi:hypothetical protein
MNEDGDGTMAEAERRRSRTNPEKWDSRISNIRDTRISLEKYFLGFLLENYSQRKN